MVHLDRRSISFILPASLIAVFMLVPLESAAGWKVDVQDQDKTCYRYTYATKTCFIQSHVNGRVVLQLHLTPTSEAEATTPPRISWFRRVKLRNRHALAVVNLLEGGRPPEFMVLSDDKTELTISILSEYDMSRNSFKARVGSKESGDHQNFVIESPPVDIEEPDAGNFVAINTMDYFTIPGRNAHFDWSIEGARHLPRNVGISHDGKRLVIRHYVPADDSGVYVCDVYSPTDHFVAGRRFILGSGNAAGQDNSDLLVHSSSTPYTNDRSGDTALYEWEALQPVGPWLEEEADLDVAPLSISEMVHTFKNNGDFVYVLRGRTQYLACVPSNMAPVDLKTVMGLSFAWDRPKEGDVIRTFDPGRYLTVEDGILEVSSVGPDDSGRLECKASYHDNTGARREKIYSYNIEVFTLPDVVYSVSVAYTADACDSEQQSAVFKQHLGAHLSSSVTAGDTSYEITDFAAVCHDSPGSLSGAAAVRSVNLVRFDVVVKHRMISRCSMECMVGEMETKTRLIGMKLVEFFSREQENKLYESGPFRLIPNTVRISLKYRCEEGYGLHTSICVACRPGSYSNLGTTECSQCPVGTYQVGYGAMDCTQCPEGEFTYWSGAISDEQCQVRAAVAGIMMGAFGLMALIGLVVSCILYRYGNRRLKAVSLQDPLVVGNLSRIYVGMAPKDIAKKPSRQTTKQKKYLSMSDLSGSGDQSEMEGLLQCHDDEDVTAVCEIQSQQGFSVPVDDDAGCGGVNGILQPGSRELRHEQQDRNRAYSVYHKEVTDLQDPVHQGSGMYLDSRVNLPDIHHIGQTGQQRDQFNHLDRTQMVTHLVPSEQLYLMHPSINDSFAESPFGESMVLQRHPPAETQITPEHSSHIRIISPESLLQPQAPFPSQQFTVHKDSFHPERYPRPNEHPEITLSPSNIHKHPIVSPSQISVTSTISSTLLPTSRQQSFSSVGPSSPISILSLSEFNLPGSADMPVDLSESDSEVEIGSFLTETDRLPAPEAESLHSSLISRPKPSPGGNSVGALIASYQSLSQSGSVPPPPARQVSHCSIRSTSAQPMSPRKSAISLRGKSDSNPSEVLSESLPQFSKSVLGEQNLVYVSSHKASSDMLVVHGMASKASVLSVTKTPQKELSRTLTPTSSLDRIRTPFTRPPVSPQSLPGDLGQTASIHSHIVSSAHDRFRMGSSPPPRTPQQGRSGTMTPTSSKEATPSVLFSTQKWSPETITGDLKKRASVSSHTSFSVDDQSSIDSFSPQGTPQESRSKTVTPTLPQEFIPLEPPSAQIGSSQGGPVAPHTPSIQQSDVYPEDSLTARMTPLMTSPAGRPVNPFKLHRIRRQSLAAQMSSSHLTTTLPVTSTSAMETSTLGVSLQPQIEAAILPTPPRPMLAPPAAVPSLPVATPPSAAPPTVERPISAPPATTIPPANLVPTASAPTTTPSTITPSPITATPLNVPFPPNFTPLIPSNLAPPTTPAPSSVVSPPTTTPSVSNSLHADAASPTFGHSGGGIPPPPPPPPPPPTGEAPSETSVLPAVPLPP